jgi:hypothetical protein
MVKNGWNYTSKAPIYRVIQEETAILWEMIVCVILSKKVHVNMGPILNGYRDKVKRKYGPSCEHEQQLRNKNITTNITCMQVLTIVLLMICNGQDPGSSTSGTSHNKFSKMPPPTSMRLCIVPRRCTRMSAVISRHSCELRNSKVFLTQFFTLATDGDSPFVL